MELDGSDWLLVSSLAIYDSHLVFENSTECLAFNSLTIGKSHMIWG